MHHPAAGSIRQLAGRGTRPVSPSGIPPAASNDTLDASPEAPEASGSSPDVEPGRVSPSGVSPEASNEAVDAETSC
jgi:hypothetical protein